MRRRIAILILSMACVPDGVLAQSTNVAAPAGPGAAQPWSFYTAASAYLFPAGDDYVEPIVALDHAALHVEGRYNYEARRSGSAFIGWNCEFGSTVVLRLTPMFGAVIGDIDGVIPAVELDLSWKRLELYSEGEFVIAVDRANRFIYNWSEASVWVAEWIRVGVVTDRTHMRGVPLSIQPGVLVGAKVSKFEPSLYLLNPGSDAHYLVASIAVEF
jgi:hypothetical protein